MTIADININGHTYTDAMWRANWEGTISAIANDIASVVAAAELVGTLYKSIAGDTLITGLELQNVGFVFYGTLGGNASITWDAGFSGPAHIINNTTGGFWLYCGLPTGERVSIPPGGSATAFCDGGRFALMDGVARSATGADVPGTLWVGGNANISGGVNIGGRLDVTDAFGVGGQANLYNNVYVGGGLNVAGTSSFTGPIYTAGSANVGGGLTVGGAVGLSNTLTVTGETYVGGNIWLTAGAVVARNPSGEQRAYLSAPAGASAWVVYESSSSTRWLVGRSNTAETGGGGGSDFNIVRANDAGVPVGIPISIRRHDGVIVLNDLPTSGFGLPTNAVWKDPSAGNVLRAN